MILQKKLPYKIANGLYVLGNDHFFSFLLTGKYYALIEAGVSATAPLVAKQLAILGIEPTKIRYLVVPHAHFDHLGGLPYYQGLFPWAQIICSAEAQKIMSKARVLELFFQDDVITSTKLKEKGYGQRTFCWLPGAIMEAGMVVGEEDVVDLGDGTILKFLAVPGHSPCSLAVYLPKQDALLVSDSLGFFLGPQDNFPLFLYNYQFYIDSIQKLSQIRASIIATAHNFIFTNKDAVKCFTVAQNAAEELSQFIKNARGNDETLIENLYNYYYRNSLLIYSSENIKSCLELLIRRTKGAN